MVENTTLSFSKIKIRPDEGKKQPNFSKGSRTGPTFGTPGKNMINPNLIFPTCQKLSELLVNHLPKLIDESSGKKSRLVNLDKTHAKDSLLSVLSIKRCD